MFDHDDPHLPPGGEFSADRLEPLLGGMEKFELYGPEKIYPLNGRATGAVESPE
jgi:hypothetical protein